MSNGIANTYDDIPDQALVAIAIRNRIQRYLHSYLAARHDKIFCLKAAQNRDYAVLFFLDSQKDALLNQNKDDKSSPPTPQVEFFAEKDHASSLLGTNPNSTLAWRHSPKLELMY